MKHYFSAFRLVVGIPKLFEMCLRLLHESFLLRIRGEQVTLQQEKHGRIIGNRELVAIQLSKNALCREGGEEPGLKCDRPLQKPFAV